MNPDRFDVFRQALVYPLKGTNFSGLGQHYIGKVRDNYTLADGRRVIVVSDRISAFDRVLGTLPLKGQLLNFVAAWWFEQTRDVAKNHVISVPDPNVMLVEECTPLPVEMVVRAYLTGTTSTSIWVHYANGKREFCGHTLPDGMRQHQKLAEPILTPSTKAQHGDHDLSLARNEILAITQMKPEDFDRAAELAFALFRRGQELCAKKGLILVDTKYEFGKNKNGEIVVIDEIHTPDSSRFWYESTYAERFAAGQDPESFDKEYLRRWLVAAGFRGEGEIPEIPDDIRVEASLRYLHAIELIVGKEFKPDLEEPIRRMRLNLADLFS